MLPVMLTITVCGIIIIFFTRQAKFLNVSNEVDNLARKTILAMESKRGLTYADMQQVQEKMEAMGVREISFDGTSFYDPARRLGDDISFCVSGIYGEQSLKFRGILNIDLPGVERQIQVTRCSVVMK